MNRAFSNSPAPQQLAGDLANMSLGGTAEDGSTQGYLSRHASPAPDASAFVSGGPHPADQLLMAHDGAGPAAAAPHHRHHSQQQQQHVSQLHQRRQPREHQAQWEPRQRPESYGPEGMYGGGYAQQMVPPNLVAMPPPYGAFMPGYGFVPGFSPPTSMGPLAASLAVPVALPSHGPPQGQAYGYTGAYGGGMSPPRSTRGRGGFSGVGPEVSAYSAQLEPYFQSLGFDPQTAQVAAQTMASNVASMFPLAPPRGTGGDARGDYPPRGREGEAEGGWNEEEEEGEPWPDHRRGGNRDYASGSGGPQVPPEVMQAAYHAAMQAIAAMQGQYGGPRGGYQQGWMPREDRQGPARGGNNGGGRGGSLGSRPGQGMDRRGSHASRGDDVGEPRAPRGPRGGDAAYGYGYQGEAQEGDRPRGPRPGGPREQPAGGEGARSRAVRLSESMRLSDLEGRALEYATDQNGSRFIQQRLEAASDAEVDRLLDELEESLLDLMTDMFGNYVVQRALENGSEACRERIYRHIAGNVRELSLQMYGCRVVQKAIEVLPERHRCSIASELQPHALQCVKDQNGNHVVQKVIELVRCSHVDQMIAEIADEVGGLFSGAFVLFQMARDSGC